MSELFIQNKYYRWYLAIVAKDDENGYVERHHVIPKSMGGRDNKTNLVRLNFRKHFLAHWLLTKCVKGEPDRKKMLNALSRMRSGAGGKRIISSWQYAVARQAGTERLLGNQHLLGHKHSKETRIKMGNSRRGSKRSDETKLKMSRAAFLVQGPRRRKECAEDPKAIEHMFAMSHKRLSDPEDSIKRAKIARDLWATPSYREHVLAARKLAKLKKIQELQDAKHSDIE